MDVSVTADQLEMFPSAEPTVRPAVELPPLAHESADRDLMSRVPGHVRFGTSSWTFPGWGGVVYRGDPTERDLIQRGLQEYARYPLFRTVGVDRSFYAPLEEPVLKRYADQLPGGFECVSKVWGEITTMFKDRARADNPQFLNVELFESAVLDPLRRHFASHTGPLVLEFPPVWHYEVPHPERFAERLHAFFSRVPSDLRYAVELRNRQLLSRPYLEVLREHRVAHVLNYWERMPTIGRQLAMDVLTAPFVVARLLIPPGKRYAEQKRRFAPFHRVVQPDNGMRADVAELAVRCAELNKALFVIVNNKAEGCSPLTIRALAQRVSRPRSADDPQ